ncbi:hypothetical protein [Flavobacterium taihuense]|uniref:Phospholipase D-like domain-containing protein n=1 Tax=Flavobacterium taihuense TaxID=2857508 RepID=A0ABS6XWM1_9FLAO|nr:hypothetical protein [Flavobacterium taihuense]MBW4361052.1 hypothetical protein [Flavobacterium taihuense]
MVFIPVMEISGKIMTLIEDAEKELIIVSPYVDIKNWDKLKRCLKNAIERKVEITFYVRENVKQDLEPIRQLNVKIVFVKDLHAKIYLNDTYGIVSSQNLYQYSDINSIDFAYSTEIDKERNQLVKLIDKYLKNSKFIGENILETKTEVEKELLSDVMIENEEMKKNIFPLNEIDLEKIKEWFQEKFPEIKINSSKQYVYCKSLFPFGDVMFREGFEIRFFFNVENNDRFIKIIQGLNFENNNYRYEKILATKKSQSPVLLFIPQEVTDVQKLVFDYVFMAKTILDKTRNIKIQNMFY